jgi:hypothetical protein
MNLLGFFPKKAAVLSRPTGSYVNGRWVAGTASTSNILIIRPQPLPGKDLQVLPEGDRTYVHLVSWSDAEIHNDDILTINSLTYRVVHVEPWNEDGGGYRFFIRLVQDGN